MGGGEFAIDVRGDGQARSEVVAYCAQDQVYAEKIFADFEKQTGIRVLAVYDSEAVKTVGLANRLLAEQRHPQCDVFWGNEEMRTRLLAAKGVFRETNGWAAFGYRSRRLVINTNNCNANWRRTILWKSQMLGGGKVCAGVSAIWNDGGAFQCLTAGVGRGELETMVRGTGGESALAGGWQFASG